MQSLKIIFFFFTLGILCQYSSINAQVNDNSGISIISDLLEELVASELENADINEIAEDLYYLLEHPVNLNQANEEDLKQIHILNDFQIYTLLEYIRDFGPVLSIGELQTIIGFTNDVIEKIKPFIVVDPVQNQETDSSGHKFAPRHQIFFRYLKDFTPKKGFVSDSSAHFLGKNHAMMLRYELNSGGDWKAGFTLDQDAGESFHPFSKIFIPDFTSAYIETKLKGIIKQLNFGDFKASYGQGLVLSGYPQRKGTEVLINQSPAGIRKYSSAGENDFFRGAAVKLEKENVSMDIFFSGMNRDATIYYDSCNYFRSLSSAGLHRTYPELEKKKALLQTSFGVHTLYKIRFLDLGLTFFSQNFDADYLVRTNPFNNHRFQKGDNIWNISSDYKVNLHRAIFFGEIAGDVKGRVALLSGITAELHPLVRYSLIYRKYHPSYISLKAGGFGEKGITRNEEGYYMGIEMYLIKNIKIDIFSDHYKYPFLDLSSTGPSSGNEYFLNLKFNKWYNLDLIFRSRYEKSLKKSDSNGGGIDLMDICRKLSNRIELKCEIFPVLEFTSRTELSHFQEINSAWTKGYYCGNDISLKSSDSKWKCWVRYSVFDIPGWNNRIYAYENDVLYSFMVPSYNSRGSRFAVLFKVPVTKTMELWIKYSNTSYLEIRTTGSGLDEVKSDRDPAITVQVRMKL